MDKENWRENLDDRKGRSGFLIFRLEKTESALVSRSEFISMLPLFGL